MSNETVAAEDPLAANYPAPDIVECPYPYYKELRERAPVHQLPNGDYVVSSWEHLKYIASRPDLYSNVIGPETPGFAESVWVGNEPETGDLSKWPLPFTDLPEQKLKRSLLLPIVDPTRLKSFEPMIRAVANELIDSFIDRGQAEFIADFAAHLPPKVMLNIFDLPPEDEPLVRGWMSVAQGQGFRHATDEEKAIHLAASKEARAYFRKLVIDRYENPVEADFLSELVRSKIDRDGDLDLYYLVPEVTTLYQASYHNTVHMLANTMSLLLENPSEYARVREDRSLIRLMVEESLRMESPVQWLQRVVTEDTELGGVPLAKGAVLLVLFGAANRDKEVFDDPDTFLVDRPGLIAKQLAFGFGVHKCLGARLARLEGQLAFEELFERLGAIRPVPGADDGTHITSVNHRAVTSVHIAFDPPT